MSPQTSGGGFTLISSAGRRPLASVVAGGREMVLLEDLASLFGLSVRGDRQDNTITVSYQNRVIVLTANQPVVSVSGRLVSLPAPPTRSGQGWLVPVDFLSRALALVYDTPIELRRQARLIVLGEDVRVPQVAIRLQSAEDLGRITFEIRPATSHTVSQEGRRLTVRFDADALDAAYPAATESDLIAGIGPGEAPTSVAIDLGPRYGSHEATSSPGPDGAGGLVIDIRPVAPRTTERAPGRPERAAPVPDRAPIPLPDFRTAPTVRTVAIDPGHGGGEEGAAGPDGMLEKMVTLEVAQRLRAAIESRLGLRVVLTRSGDETVALDQRAAIANNNKADLFVSLHANASIRASAAGAEVFYLSLDEYGEEAQELAESEGQQIAVIGGGTREIDLILWEMAQVRYLQQSAQLATIVEDELRSRLEMSPRAIQQAPFRVLVGANMPAVLVEMGFITNPAQERQLSTPAFQTAVVDALVDSIVRFRDYLGTASHAAAADGSPVPDAALPARVQ